jgi:flagellar hook protein FlgE
MLGSIYIGLSGLSAFSKGLQTISNNVTNLNTPGFKATSFNFADSFTFGGLGSSFSHYVGGRQIGTGVRYGAETIDFRQGDLRQTGGDLDLAIQGSGMLVLKNGSRTYYTRTGQFQIDKDGYVALLGSNYRLGVLNGSGEVTDVSIDSKKTNAPVATTKITFSGILSSDIASAPVAHVADIGVFDSAGARHSWKVTFTNAAAGEWDVTVADENGAAVGPPTSNRLKFNGQSVDSTTSHLTFTTTPAGADPLSVDLDFSSPDLKSASSGSVETIRAATVDGRALGTLASVTVDSDGKLKLTYSNQQTELLGAVAIADFRDPQALLRIGTGLFEDRAGAGVRYLGSGQDGVGTLATRQVEASNVDLSAQFGDLILVQRGFQASSQVISISNDMIQQLFGIRGQG